MPENEEDAVNMGITIGDPVAFDIKYVKLGKDVVIGKALDNRAGCIIMVEALKLFKKTEVHHLRCRHCARGSWVAWSSNRSVWC